MFLEISTARAGHPSPLRVKIIYLGLEKIYRGCFLILTRTVFFFSISDQNLNQNSTKMNYTRKAKLFPKQQQQQQQQQQQPLLKFQMGITLIGRSSCDNSKTVHFARGRIKIILKNDLDLVPC